jgi:hypothetical protein
MHNLYDSWIIQFVFNLTHLKSWCKPFVEIHIFRQGSRSKVLSTWSHEAHWWSHSRAAWEVLSHACRSRQMSFPHGLSKSVSLSSSSVSYMHEGRQKPEPCTGSSHSPEGPSPMSWGSRWVVEMLGNSHLAKQHKSYVCVQCILYIYIVYICTKLLNFWDTVKNGEFLK